METQALARYIRISPRKLLVIARLVDKMKPEAALEKLDTVNKKGAGLLKQVIQSALANAKAHRMDTAKLHFKSIEVSKGTVMKRFRAVSRGMAHTYKKKTSHIKVVVAQNT